MLKYIHFILSEYYYDMIFHELGRIEAEVHPHGVSVAVSCRKQEENEFCKSDSGNETETLYITDDEATLTQLLYQGKYAVALYHDGNRNLLFTAALYALENIRQLEYQTYDQVYRRLAELPWDILETERLTVRESTIDDVEDFYRIYQNPEIIRYLENLFDEHDEERAYMRDYIKQIYGFYGYGLWTVILKETGEIIGRAGLSVRPGYEQPELGFVIAARHQRKGYALEACKAIMHYAKDELYFDVIQAFTEKDNLASQELLKKLGFSFEKNTTLEGHNYLQFTCSLPAK